MAMAPSLRTIDDFLEQLYQEYKKRLPSASSSYSISQYRHYLPLPLLALCVANSSDATEILMLSYLLANRTFRHDMFSDNSNGDDYDSSSIEGAEYLAASIFLGMLLGGTVLGFLSDHIGRRPALLAGLLINATAGTFSSLPFLTPTIVQLTKWRFIGGIGIGATVPSIFSLASEWSPKEVRGAMVTFVASFWMVGSLFVSGLAWLLFRGSDNHDGQYHSLLPMWRIFAALCAMPSALGAFLVYSYVPESPRFLASAKYRYDDSAHVCNQIAVSLGLKLMKSHHNEEGNALLEEVGGTNTIMQPVSIDAIKSLTGEEMRQTHASSVSTDNVDIIALTLSARLLQTLHKLLDTLQKLFSPQLLPRTTLPLQTIWFALSFSTYGITTWINTLFVEIRLENIYFNSFLFALANLPGNVISIMYSDKWGRKRMLVGSLFGAAGGLAAFATLVYWGDAGDDNAKAHGLPSHSRSNARTFGIVLSACIFQMFSIVSWNAIDILTGEMFPTRVRSAGMGVCTCLGRFGAMFAQFVNARLMLSGGGGEGSSASVLVVAALTLLMGAGIPMFLERDMALGELKDEIVEEATAATDNRSYTLGCIGKNTKVQKDHLSDDETDFGLRNRAPSHESLREESFLL